MKKDYTKPLVTVIALVADHPLAHPLWDDYNSDNDIFVGEEELE